MGQRHSDLLQTQVTYVGGPSKHTTGQTHRQPSASWLAKTDRQTDRQIDRQTASQPASRHAGRQAGRQTESKLKAWTSPSLMTLQRYRKAPVGGCTRGWALGRPVEGSSGQIWLLGCHQLPGLAQSVPSKWRAGPAGRRRKVQRSRRDQ